MTVVREEQGKNNHGKKNEKIRFIWQRFIWLFNLEKSFGFSVEDGINNLKKKDLVTAYQDVCEKCVRISLHHG